MESIPALLVSTTITSGGAQQNMKHLMEQGKLLGQPEEKQWQKWRKNWCVINTELQHWGELRLIKFPWFLGRVTLGKHLWCCVLPRAAWTQLSLTLRGSVGYRTAQLHSRLTSKGPVTSPQSPPALAAKPLYNTHLCSTVWWLGQPRLSGTIPTPTLNASVLPSHPRKANSTSRRKQRRAWGGMEALSQSTVFSWAPSASPSTWAWCNKQLSGSHWPFLSHPPLPLFINPPFSSPSLTSIG